MKKQLEIRPVIRNALTSKFEFISDRLTIEYSAGSDSTTTVGDLIIPSLKSWCEHYGMKIATDPKIPNHVSSTHKPLLSRHWKVIAAKTTKNTKQDDTSTFQPMEETDQTLNVDRFMTLAYKRTITTDATMPEMWLLPISNDAKEFCEMMKDKFDPPKEEVPKEEPVINKTKNDVKLSPVNTATKTDQETIISPPQYIYSPTSPKPNGIFYQHKLENENLPESVAQINEHFDKLYTEFIDRKMWLFRFEASSPEDDTSTKIHEAKRYVHWSDILKNSNNNGRSHHQNPYLTSSFFREGGQSLKNFQGDKSALSEALGVAWEAAADAEEQAMENWNRIQAEKKKRLEAQIANDEKEIATAEKREEELRKHMEGITVKKAEAEVKEDRIKSLQEEIRVLELRLETSRQVKNQIEEEKRQQKEKEAELRERLLNEEKHSPLRKHTRSLGAGTALEAAMSVLSPEIAAQVQSALSSSSHSASSTQHQQSESSPIVSQRQQKKAIDHLLNYSSFASSASPAHQNQTEQTRNEEVKNNFDPKIDGFKGYRYEHKNLLGSENEVTYSHNNSMTHETSNNSFSSSSFSSRKRVDVAAALRQIHGQYGYSPSGEFEQPPAPTNPLLNTMNTTSNSSVNFNNNTNMTPTPSSGRFQTSSTPHEMRNWTDPGSLSSAFAINNAYHQKQQQQQQQQNLSRSSSSDMRVPLRALADDLDAYLARSTANSNQVLTSVRGGARRNEQHQQQQEDNSNDDQTNMPSSSMRTSSESFDRDHYYSSSAAALLARKKDQYQQEDQQHQQGDRYKDPSTNVGGDTTNYYGTDMETRKRILNRVHELKSVLNHNNNINENPLKF